MKIKLDVSAVLAVALGCFASSASANVKYTPEYTNDWITVSGEQLDDATPTEGAQIGTGGWFAVPAGGVTLGSEMLLIDTDVTDVNSALVYTNATSVGKSVYRIEATIKVTLSTELPDADTLNTANAKTALCVCTNGVEGAGAATNWWALVNGSWSNLGGSPETDATYTIALESDTAGAIRYFAKPDGGEFVELTSGWTANSRSNEPITKLAFAGSTELSDIKGFGVAQGYAVEGGEVYESLADAIEHTPENGDVLTPVSTGGVVVASAKIDKAWMTNNGIATSDALNAVAAKGNGIVYWQSYVLGLDPNDTSSKPVVQPVQNAATDAIEFSMGNVAVNAEAGVPVKYRVKSYSDPACTAHVDGDSAPTVAGETATASLPDSGVRYYKMEIQFGE